MYHKVAVVASYIICINAIGIFHENTKLTFKPDNDSELFGYSVVLNRYGLIVGAPKAKSRENPNSVISPGLCFNCSLNSLDSINGTKPAIVTCNPIGWQPYGAKRIFQNRFGALTQDNFFKDDMWYGATAAFLTNEKLLVCAPRYMEPYSSKHLLAHGVCTVRKRNRESLVHSLSDRQRQAFVTDGKRREYGEAGTHLNYYAYGQAGMSVKVIGNTSVIIGVPGLLQWTGGVVNYFYSSMEDNTYLSKQVIANPYFTPELGPDDYFGYSVDAGVFLPEGGTFYVGGAPRSMRGYGQVLVFETPLSDQNPLTVHAKVHGPQLGAYFGASLCCLDIDGDGITDMLVGAPNYVMKDGGLPYDQGAVFVYMTKQRGDNFTLEESGFVKGSGESGARFGTVIADLGDVDGDGFRDVAIAAPWENDGSGAVYIYRGDSKGLKSQYVQKLVAEGARSFGISISTGVDVDNNNCNDMAVGAAISSSVYLYRCVPTITVHASIKVPDAMNLPHNATEFTVLFCVTAPRKPQWAHVKAEFKATIVIDPEENRAMVSGDSKYKISVTPGDERCDEQSIDVKLTADLSKPISIKFFLEPDELLKNNSTVFNTHAARISEDSVLESFFLMQLIRDCGEDMICTPWLVLTLECLEKCTYTPGTSETLGAKLTILNKEEPAYGAKVNITLPLTPKRLPSLCSLEDLVLTCDVPAPLFRNEEVFLEIELEYKETNDEYLKIVAVLNDPVHNRNISEESVKEVLLQITPLSIFNVAGNSQPNDTMAVTREKLSESEDVVFSHYIEVTNYGPSNCNNLEMSIFLPETVNLSSPIKGCEQVYPTELNCVWSVPRTESRSAVLSLWFDMAKFGEILQQNATLDITTKVVLTKILKGNTSAEITTTLVLDPASPIWPMVLVGVLAGFVVLAVIIYLLHRYGFFTRQQRERLRQLQDHQPLVDQHESTSSTGSPSIDAADADASTLELLAENSE